MANLTITMNLDNAEFDDDWKEAVDRHLEKVARQINAGFRAGSIFDINGNRIGGWDIAER